jgi:hypothetical protein
MGSESLVQLVGSLLPLLLGVMINPPYQLAVVVLVIGVGGRRKAGVYLAGYAVGQMLLSLLAFGGLVQITDSEPSTAVAVVKIGLGLFFVVLGVKQVRGRPRHGVKAEQPGWMHKLMTMPSGAAFGIGVISATVFNVKNVSLMIAAADEVAIADVSSATKVIVAVVFTILAPALVAAPWIYATVRGPAADVQLAHLGDWLTQTSWIILTVLFAFMSASLIGGGLDSL